MTIATKMVSREDPEGAISFADPAVQKCPYEAYDRLRERAPVYRDPITGNFVLTRYEDIRKVVLKPNLFSSNTGLGAVRENAAEETNAVYDEHGYRPLDTMLSSDPPSHRFYRQLVDKAFAPSKVTAMEPRIREIANQLIDEIIDRPEVEFVSEFANRLPMHVIAEEINIAHEDMYNLKLWADVSIELQDPTMTLEREIEVATIITDMQKYMARSIAQMRAEPDGRLLSRIVHAQLDSRGLDMRELLSILQQLITGGSDTTTAALSGGLRLLIEQPPIQDRLRNETHLIANFVEETLRLASPLQTMFRRASEDIDIGEVTIPKGSLIEVRYGSGNRDPAVYECPERLDVTRANAKSHLAFGAGIHLCIGNQLARAELKIGFDELLKRARNVRFSRGEDSCALTDLYIANSLTELWIAFDKI